VLRNEEIIYVGNDWRADNRTSSHQIARVLSTQNRLLYVEAAGQRAPKASRRDFGKIITKLGKAWSDPVEVQENVFVFSPLILPFHRYRVVRRFNRWILSWSIRRAARKVGFTNPILWVILPHYSSLVETNQGKGTVYYVVDEYSSLPDVDPERIRQMEKTVLEKADVVFTVSEILTESKGRINKNTYFSPHGVDTDHFGLAARNETVVPDEIARFEKPVIGFFGLIEAWVDLDLIGFLARERPQYNFVMIGRVARDTQPVDGLSNVHFLGQRPYDDIPRYLKGFDVGLIPFVVNDVIKNSNPLKLKEYLAGGKPVVSVAIREVDKYDEIVYVARTYEEFLSCVDRALEGDSENQIAGRIAAMRSESWPAKVETISERVSRHIKGVCNE